MRRWIMALCASCIAITPIFAASTSVSSSAGVNNSVSATSGAGGFANSSSFGLANSSIIVAPNAVATQSHEVNVVSGIAIGQATFSGTANAHASAYGMSSWSAH